MTGGGSRRGSASRHGTVFGLGFNGLARRAVEWSPPAAPGVGRDRRIPDLLDNTGGGALAVDVGPRTHAGSWCDRCSYRSVCPASREIRYEPVEWYEDDED